MFITRGYFWSYPDLSVLLQPPCPSHFFFLIPVVICIHALAFTVTLRQLWPALSSCLAWQAAPLVFLSHSPLSFALSLPLSISSYRGSLHTRVPLNISTCFNIKAIGYKTQTQMIAIQQHTNLLAHSLIKLILMDPGQGLYYVFPWQWTEQQMKTPWSFSFLGHYSVLTHTDFDSLCFGNCWTDQHNIKLIVITIDALSMFVFPQLFSLC